jgi:A/G-specific adenine glycosylase
LSLTPGQRALKHDAVSRKNLQQRLLRWYDCNRRDLPWRKNRDPYCVWISEIMLQQTRVGAVLPHYETFLQQFPTVRQLAVARPARVLAAWSGLGYYRRARMLHAAARTLVKEHAGKFPETAAEWQKLAGIGPYTAAAIASIAFGQAVAVVDGNVARVLSRMEGKRVAGKDLWQAAQRRLSRERPGDFNQAMMELGAIVCLPRAPRCGECPLAALCATKGPLRDPVKTIRQQRKHICYQLACSNGSTFLVQRPRNATLMPGMWELPPCLHTQKQSWLTLRHSITVTDYTVRVVKSCKTNGMSGRWVEESRIASLPLTGLARKILRAAKLI